MQLLAKFKQILYLGFKATLNFRGLDVPRIVFVRYQLEFRLTNNHRTYNNNRAMNHIHDLCKQYRN